MEWISVDDRYPDEGEEVLLLTDLGQTVGSREVKHDGSCYRLGNDAMAWDYDYNLGDVEVISWMPLPDWKQ